MIYVKKTYQFKIHCKDDVMISQKIKKRVVFDKNETFMLSYG